MYNNLLNSVGFGDLHHQEDQKNVVKMSLESTVVVLLLNLSVTLFLSPFFPFFSVSFYVPHLLLNKIHTFDFSIYCRSHLNTGRAISLMLLIIGSQWGSPLATQLGCFLYKYFRIPSRSVHYKFHYFISPKRWNYDFYYKSNKILEQIDPKTICYLWKTTANRHIVMLMYSNSPKKSNQDH